MQLKLSLAATLLISASLAQAEDYVLVQVLQYNENDNRVAVSAPSIMINKDFGTDYTLNASVVNDTVSGASPTYYVKNSVSTSSGASAPVSQDTTSGASAYSRGIGINANDIVNDIGYGNIKFDEERLAGGATLTSRFVNRDELTVGVNGSTEHDFDSISGSVEYMHWLSSAKNQSLSLGLSYQHNEITARCVDMVADECDASSGASEVKTASALNAELGFFSNINADSYIKTALFYVQDAGYLTDPYLNVVRNNNGFTADIVGESRPDARYGFGGSLEYVNAITQSLTLHLSYRYYWDDWLIESHTISSDVYYELGSDWIFKLGVRGYTQSAAFFYNGTANYFTTETYASSDYRLSNFDAINYKSNIEYKVMKDLSVNVSVNYYEQTTGLQAIYFITGFKYNF